VSVQQSDASSDSSSMEPLDRSLELADTTCATAATSSEGIVKC
jgi:hypothetical protein